MENDLPVNPTVDSKKPENNDEVEQNRSKKDEEDSEDGVIVTAESEGPSVEQTLVQLQNTNNGVAEVEKGDEKESFLLGMKPATLDLYEGPKKCSCCTNWVEQYPDDWDLAGNVEEAEGTKQYALLARNRQSHKKHSGKPLELDSVVIHSPLIKAILEDVLEDYPGVTVDLDTLTFETPFKPFFHRWEQFEDALEMNIDDRTRAHLRLLRDTIQEGIKMIFTQVEDMTSHDVITYEYLWAIFKPGELVCAQEHDAIFKFRSGDYDEDCLSGIKYFQLDLSFVAWDGEQFGYRRTTSRIYEFEGTMKITELQLFPLHFHSAAENVKAACLNRGKHYVELRGIHHLQYRGPFWKSERLYDDFQPRVLTSGNVQTQPLLIEISTKKLSTKQLSRGSRNDTEDVASGFGASGIKMSDEELMLCDAVVRGYAMKSKKWGLFRVENFSEIVWNDKCFEQLVLPHDHKELSLGFVESHMERRDTFDDFVHGKGRGMIFLLSGPPGVGKTLTCEAVAEKLEAPLYPVSAGELGFTVSEVEENVGSILELVERWHAVLLLDEADVFLEQRTTNNLERNRLVSVFLRKLEYYEGVLFLTTNLASNIDAAFHSRIDIHLEYSELDRSSRLSIWKNFFAVAKLTVELRNEELDKLAENQLNGREIKSAVKQAQLLAHREGGTLRMSHIERVLQLMRPKNGEIVVAG